MIGRAHAWILATATVSSITLASLFAWAMDTRWPSATYDVSGVARCADDRLTMLHGWYWEESPYEPAPSKTAVVSAGFARKRVIVWARGAPPRAHRVRAVEGASLRVDGQLPRGACSFTLDRDADDCGLSWYVPRNRTAADCFALGGPTVRALASGESCTLSGVFAPQLELTHLPRENRYQRALRVSDFPTLTATGKCEAKARVIRCAAASDAPCSQMSFDREQTFLLKDNAVVVSCEAVGDVVDGEFRPHCRVPRRCAADGPHLDRVVGEPVDLVPQPCR